MEEAQVVHAKLLARMDQRRGRRFFDDKRAGRGEIGRQQVPLEDGSFAPAFLRELDGTLALRGGLF
jgi:hypothetical protein